jgi:hypothetical protein
MGRCPWEWLMLVLCYRCLGGRCGRITVWGYGFCRCGLGRCCKVTWTDGYARCRKVSSCLGRESFEQAADGK